MVKSNWVGLLDEMGRVRIHGYFGNKKWNVVDIFFFGHCIAGVFGTY